MRHFLAVIGLCLACVTPVLASRQYTIHDAHYGATVPMAAQRPSMNWEKQAMLTTVSVKAPITTTGHRARRAAFAQALALAKEELCTAMGDMRLTGYATFTHIAAAKILPNSKVDAFLCNAVPVAESWDSATHTLLLTCALPLCGPGSPNEFAARVLTFHQRLLETNPNPAPRIEGMVLQASPPVSQRCSAPYSGLILDCTGMKYLPALLPALLTKDGVELWGTRDINPLLVQEQGLVSIVQGSLREAMASPRVGVSPLIMRPLGVSGLLQGDLVLSDEDAELLKAQDAETHFLSTLSVVVLID
jgi:hypothetical protein